MNQKIITSIIKKSVFKVKKIYCDSVSYNYARARWGRQEHRMLLHLRPIDMSTTHRIRSSSVFLEFIQDCSAPSRNSSLRLSSGNSVTIPSIASHNGLNTVVEMWSYLRNSVTIPSLTIYSSLNPVFDLRHLLVDLVVSSVETRPAHALYRLHQLR